MMADPPSVSSGRPPRCADQRSGFDPRFAHPRATAPTPPRAAEPALAPVVAPVVAPVPALASRFALLPALALAVLAAALPAAASAALWSRTYGGSATFEQPLAMHELADGTLLIGGVTDSWGTGTGEAWRIRLDADGAILEERVYGNPLPGGAADIAFDADGGMAVVGAHTLDLFTDRDAWIHHVDAGGAIDWQWSFDADPGLHALHTVAATSDGGYLAAGSTAFAPEPPISAWAVKLDGGGNVVWQRQYHGGVAEHANFAIETMDGGYALAGWTTSSGAGATDAWLLKLTGTGAVEWQKTYGGSGAEEATGLIQTADGGYALAAFTDTWPASGHGAWILRLDAGGGLLWHAVMEDWGDFRDVIQTADGDLLATGRMSGPGGNDLWAVKFRDADGDVLWQRAYEGPLGDWGSGAVELHDRSLLIGGVWGFGFAEEDIWIQRTDSYGTIPSCGLIRETAIPATSPAVTVAPAGAVASPPAPSPEPVAFVSAPSAAAVDEKCRAVAGAGDRGPRAAGRRLTAYPSPVREAGIIAFELEAAERVRLDVVGPGGTRVASLVDGTLPPGAHRIAWDPRDWGLPGGVYHLVLRGERGAGARRTVVLR